MALVKSHQILLASLVTQLLKNLSAMQKTHVLSLNHEDPLAHSSTLDWKIPLTEKLGGPQTMAFQKVGHD